LQKTNVPLVETASCSDGFVFARTRPVPERPVTVPPIFNPAVDVVLNDAVTDWSAASEESEHAEPVQAPLKATLEHAASPGSSVTVVPASNG
jgi:hypothetical protein